jgi:hypothetical protein
VDTPSGEVAEKSSSYDLSIFSSRANSHGAKIIAATCGDSSSSIGELWPDIDKLDEIPCKDTPVMPICDASVHGRRSTASVENASRCSRREGKNASLKDVLGTSNIKSKSHRGSSVKREVA